MKRGQINIPIIILLILIIIVLLATGYVVISLYRGAEEVNPSENLTRIDQIDDAIEHSINQTNNPHEECNDECSARGIRRCFEDGTKRCGNYDSDSCYEWSNLKPCTSNEICSSGLCVNEEDDNDEEETVPEIIEGDDYSFDEVEILYSSKFNITKIGENSLTWADDLIGGSNLIEVTYSIFNLKKNNSILVDNEEFLKIKSSLGEQKFLLNSKSYGYDTQGNKIKERSFFWSAKQIVGDVVAKNKTLPVHSASLVRKFNSSGELSEVYLSFSNDGLDVDEGTEVYDWKKIILSEEDNETDNNLSNIMNCMEEIKSGLCGISETIFPLENKEEGKIIEVYSSGILLETENILISSESPDYLLTNQQSEINITVQNRGNEDYLFSYNYFACDSLEKICSDIYGPVIVNNLEGAEYIQDGKEEIYYELSLGPLETKSFKITIIPVLPTLVISPINYFNLDYYDNDLINPYEFNFQSWIKPSQDYGAGEDKTKENFIIRCGGINQPEEIKSVRGVKGGQEDSYGFLKSKCCNGVFYPSIECCNDLDCSKGHCIDGLCINRERITNKLTGNKKVLVAYEFNEDNLCEDISMNKVDGIFVSDLEKMEEYYDHMAYSLINKSSDFVNFELTKVIRIPSDLRGFYTEEKSEQDILDYLSLNCNINVNDSDIIILPTRISTSGESAGWALTIGTGKVILYEKGNSPTLIHETGHLFGCIDLYELMGGHLQWATTLYGVERSNTDYGYYDSILEGRINEIPNKAFQVCRGHFGWTDADNNGIVDIEEN